MSLASDVSFGYEEIDARERIPKKVIGQFVLDNLNRFFVETGRFPKRILFQRDGRLLDEERKGIRLALRRFVEAHPGNASPPWVAVAVEKSTSVPLRLFRTEGNHIDRPLSGTYFLQDNRVGYLVTAGAPTLRQGTSRPLRIEVVDAGSSGLVDLAEILSDLFWLAQLNWNSPEIDIRLPITLRFTDQKLEHYALEYDGNSADDWEESEEEPDDQGGA